MHNLIYKGDALSNPKGVALSNPKGAALSNPKGAALSNPASPSSSLGDETPAKPPRNPRIYI